MNGKKVLTRPESDGCRTPTLNKTGFSWKEIAPLAIQWSEFQGPGPSLEIGAGYGDTSLLALRKGRQVIANDLSSDHLSIFASGVPHDLRTNLKILPGCFPDDLELASGSLGSVLASSVFHFLSGDQLIAGLEKIEDWLAPGGKLFIIAETPFMRVLKDFPYGERKKNSNYPGFITREEFRQYSPYADQLPEQLNWLDADVLLRDVSSKSFRIEHLAYFTRPGLPRHLLLDGRESVGLVAVKI
jgi:SAM-dependent methyltransferase